MPARKRSSLTKTSKHAKRMRLARSQESTEERESRLNRMRDRAAEARARESSADRELRLSADRQRHSLSRSSETFTERDIRLTADCERHVLSRESETYTQYQDRLTAGRERHAVSRESETYTQYQDALSRSLESDDNRLRHLEAASENYDLRVQNNIDNLSNERQNINDIRSLETNEQCEVRLSGDRFRHNIERVLSSSDHDEAESLDLLSWINKRKSGFAYYVRINYESFAELGEMNIVCSHCNSLKWRHESAGFCCSGGQVNLPLFKDPPEPLKSLLLGEHTHSKHFLDNIRAFNSAFQMTSFGAQQISEGPFMPTFKIQGQVYHLIGSLLPENQPKILQIYFISDNNEQLAVRNTNFPHLNAELILALQHMLQHVNTYVHSFKLALESIPQGQCDNNNVVINADRRPSQEHPRRYNAPTTNQVAVVLVEQECDRRDIVIRTRDNCLQRIYETHRAYDSLQYPLIYCRGEDGYNFAVYQTNPVTGTLNYRKKVSSLQFYCYHLQIRRDQLLYLQRFRSLFNQFIVDMYAKIESERLVYIHTNQRQLRVDEYVHLRDAIQRDDNPDNLGRLVIFFYRRPAVHV